LKHETNTICSRSVWCRSLRLVSSGAQSAPSCKSLSALTVPSSGLAFGSPLKSNVSAHARSMKRSFFRVLASGRAAFKRLRQLSLRRLHSGIGFARHSALRHPRLTSVTALRASESKAGNRVSLAKRFNTDRQPFQGPDQYTSGLVPLACAQHQSRSGCAPILAIGRANLSFKRTRLRRSA